MPRQAFVCNDVAGLKPSRECTNSAAEAVRLRQCRPRSSNRHYRLISLDLLCILAEVRHVQVVRRIAISIKKIHNRSLVRAALFGLFGFVDGLVSEKACEERTRSNGHDERISLLIAQHVHSTNDVELVSFG